MAVAEKQPVPKWFNGMIYENGMDVKNPYTGDSIYLNKIELSMYDLTKGAEMLGFWDDVRKGCDWFRKYSPKAYMVLLD